MERPSTNAMGIEFSSTLTASVADGAIAISCNRIDEGSNMIIFDSPCVSARV